MFNYAIITVVLLGLSIHRYLSAYRENQLLPYSMGFDVLSIIFVVLYTVSFIWMFGIIPGIVVSGLCFFQVINSSFLWIFGIPGLIRMNRNKEFPKVNAFKYGSYFFVVTSLLIMVIINFVITSYKAMWYTIAENLWIILAGFGGIVVMGNLFRLLAMRRIVRMTDED